MRQFISFSLVFWLFVAIQAATTERIITGKVTNLENQDLHKNAKVLIEIVAVSSGPGSGNAITSTVVKDAKSFPVDFKITIDPKSIVADRKYSVSAKVLTADGKILFIADSVVPVDFTAAKSSPIDVPVIPVGQVLVNALKKGDAKKACPPACRGKQKACAYGYQKKDGCEICKCNDPCNPAGKAFLCGPKERCFVDKNPDGTFTANCRSAGSKKDDKDSKKGDKESKGPKKPECSQPKVVGICRAAHPRYHYNPATKACELFNYGGCGGNKNNFETKVACEKFCKA